MSGVLLGAGLTTLPPSPPCRPSNLNAVPATAQHADAGQHGLLANLHQANSLCSVACHQFHVCSNHYSACLTQVFQKPFPWWPDFFLGPSDAVLAILPHQIM